MGHFGCIFRRMFCWKFLNSGMSYHDQPTLPGLEVRISLPTVGGPLEIIYAPPRDAMKGWKCSFSSLFSLHFCGKRIEKVGLDDPFLALKTAHVLLTAAGGGKGMKGGKFDAGRKLGIGKPCTSNFKLLI